MGLVINTCCKQQEQTKKERERKKKEEEGNKPKTLRNGIPPIREQIRGHAKVKVQTRGSFCYSRHSARMDLTNCPKMTRVLIVISLIVFSTVDWTRGEVQVMSSYTSYYGLLCYDSCDLHGRSYYWCHTRKGWDYCSPSQNVDYKGNECRSNHPCGKYGESFRWCYRNSGKWGYCGLVEPKLLLYKSSKYLAPCRDDCRYDENEEYYWCQTDQGWDYCSPLPEVTYKNEPCRSDSPCGTYGYSYNWCYTDNGNGYCGFVTETECQYESTSRVKRHPNDHTLICTVEDKGNKRTTKIIAKNASTEFAEVNNNRRNEITDLIASWDNSHLPNQARSNLITSNHNRFRVDLQGFLNINNLRHYNLQIQINGPRSSGQSTTVAQVVMPRNVDISDRYVRRAFLESLNRQARVFITFTNYCPNLPGCSG